MKNWTTQAEQRLGEYLRERAAREGFEGEDAVELKDDLRRHIHEEAEQVEGKGIGLSQLENILGRLDSGYRPVIEHEVAPIRRRGWSFGRFLLWSFGVVLPLGILIFESLSAFCGGVFFDPVPTWWHVGLVALVPAMNAWLLRGGRGAGPKVQGMAAGFALGAALFYALMFLPLIHLSIIALVVFGLGLLSLMPIFTAFASWRIGSGAKGRWGDPAPFKSGQRMGAVLALLALLVLEGSPLWTRMNLGVAAGDGDGAPAALERLRSWHSERTLLKACYEGNRGTSMGTDLSGWMMEGWKIPAMMLGGGPGDSKDSEKIRDVFFRVTGKPFNSLQPPRSNRGGNLMRGVDPLEDFEFDEHLGGDEVAVRLKHLDLAESRFDGHMDSVSRLGYGEWTMVFRNTSAQVKEARCQVRLPRDGRVSRLTLWVNGEPREAAFSTVAKVRAAYQAVAVVQRRDPVLVNVVGPDTVMVQCFPVPARGEMKIRIGVTAPLDGRRWELPRIVERNFGLAGGMEHALWIQGDIGFGLQGEGKGLAAHPDGDGKALAASLEADAVMSPELAVMTDALPDEAVVVWCEDRFAKAEERVLIREPLTVDRPAADKLVVVVDGSVSLADSKPWILQALETVPQEKLLLVLADDGARQMSAGGLKSYHFSGGRDNSAALREAVRLSKESGAPIVWIHGPQGIRLSQSEALIQLLERGSVRPVIYEVEAVTGPNRLAEAIYQTGSLRRGPTLVDPGNDFSEFLKALRTGRRESSWNWKRSAGFGSPGAKVWDQLARYWASRTVEDPLVVMTDTARANLAAGYQLVTPFSGAVVLETQAQYEEHGLSPADSDATPKIPNVPEPSSSMLLMLSAAAALMRRKRVGDEDVMEGRP